MMNYSEKNRRMDLQDHTLWNWQWNLYSQTQALLWFRRLLTSLTTTAFKLIVN